jgi:DUF2075 family protein
MRYENGKIITDFAARAKTDKSLSGIKKLYKENRNEALERSEEIIKNTYKVLMTRGMKGCYIFCEDKELQKYLSYRLEVMKNNITFKEIDEGYVMSLIQ